MQLPKSYALAISFFILGIILGSFSHYAWKYNFWFIVSMAGLIGGLLSSSQGKNLELPSIVEGSFKPGLIADALIGIAGAYVVFLIIPDTVLKTNALLQDPPQPNSLEIIKSIAIGIVGGYGGRAFLNRVIANLLNEEVKNINQKVENINKEVKNNDMAITKISKGDEANALVDIHFSRINPLDDKELAQLKQALSEASEELKIQTRLKAERAWRKEIKESPNTTKILKRAINVFRILTEIDGKAHENHGNLASALKAQEQWEEAEQEFSQAIERLDKDSNSKLRKFYELHRAICRIKSNSPLSDIMKDLQTVGTELNSLISDPRDRQIIKDWLNNQTDPGFIQSDLFQKITNWIDKE